MKVFYHNDLDGHCSAFWCTFIPEPKKEYYEINYNKPFPIGKIMPNETVYIVDFSISPEEMKDLLEITPNVVWIDHHKSSIDKYENFNKPIKGIRYSDEKEPLAGCLLTYIYVIHMLPDNKSFDIKLVEKAPYFSQLISDWDTWNLKLKNTKQFITGCEIYDTDPMSYFWNKLFNNEYIYKVIDEGKICLAYRDSWAKEFLKSYGFEIEFEGHKCYAANLGRCNSDYFKSVGGTEKYDILIPFVFTGKNWIVSLYSGHNGVDVSEIAKKYGGGGHLGASGFVCESLPFKKKL